MIVYHLEGGGFFALIVVVLTNSSMLLLFSHSSFIFSGTAAHENPLFSCNHYNSTPATITLLFIQIVAASVQKTDCSCKVSRMCGE